MEDNKDNVTISVYKGHTRYRVFRLPLKTIRRLLTINALLVVSAVVFFLAFASQFFINWRMNESVHELKKEIESLRK